MKVAVDLGLLKEFLVEDVKVSARGSSASSTNTASVTRPTRISISIEQPSKSNNDRGKASGKAANKSVAKSSTKRGSSTPKAPSKAQTQKKKAKNVVDISRDDDTGVVATSNQRIEDHYNAAAANAATNAAAKAATRRKRHGEPANGCCNH
jgi:hypothetical protein